MNSHEEKPSEAPREFYPINDYIALKPVKPSNQERKIGSIFLPDTLKSDKFVFGEVLAVGAGKVTLSGARVPPSVKVGDIVVHDKTMGEKFEYLNINCIIIDEACIQGILR
jgi:chaperonin GroES